MEHHHLMTPGAIVGTWKIASFVGRGDAVEVYSAVHMSLPLAAALKILACDDPVRAERFNLEVQFLRSSKCRSLPRFLGHGDLNGRPYIAVEFLLPVEHPAADKDIESLVLAAADGFREMHAHGLAHGRVTVQNVMRRKNGEFVLADLGLFVPFAQIGQANRASQADDIKALGELVRECFAGYPPFAWLHVVKQAMHPIPAQRYRSAAAFAYAVKTRTHGFRVALVVACLAAVALAAAVAIYCFAIL